nr:hypothetical protein [uncultured Mucilaginibacter sp.]
MEIIGNKFEVDFGVANAILSFESETQLTFTITEKGGKQANTSETVETKMTELRPQLWLITWQEVNGTTLTQVHDYENGVIYSNWTSRDGYFTNLKGTLKNT